MIALLSQNVPTLFFRTRKFEAYRLVDSGKRTARILGDRKREWCMTTDAIGMSAQLRGNGWRSAKHRSLGARPVPCCSNEPARNSADRSFSNFTRRSLRTPSHHFAPPSASASSPPRPQRQNSATKLQPNVDIRSNGTLDAPPTSLDAQGSGKRHSFESLTRR